jgi:hypothetical protein
MHVPLTHILNIMDVNVNRLKSNRRHFVPDSGSEVYYNCGSELMHISKTVTAERLLPDKNQLLCQFDNHKSQTACHRTETRSPMCEAKLILLDILRIVCLQRTRHYLLTQL